MLFNAILEEDFDDASCTLLYWRRWRNAIYSRTAPSTAEAAPTAMAIPVSSLRRAPLEVCQPALLRDPTPDLQDCIGHARIDNNAPKPNMQVRRHSTMPDLLESLMVKVTEEHLKRQQRDDNESEYLMSLVKA